MTARLISIAFDTKTETYLRESMSGDEADQLALEQIDAFGDLTDMMITLEGLPDASYMLIVGADFAKNTVVSFKLINADTKDVVHATSLDIQPVIQSAIDDCEELETLSMTLLDDEEAPQTQEAANEAEMKISQRRSAYLEGLLAPYLQDNLEFNVELLDMLDFMTYPTITGSVTGFDPEDDSPLQNVMPSGGNKYTLH